MAQSHQLMMSGEIVLYGTHISNPLNDQLRAQTKRKRSFVPNERLLAFTIIINF